MDVCAARAHLAELHAVAERLKMCCQKCSTSPASSPYHNGAGTVAKESSSPCVFPIETYRRTLTRHNQHGPIPSGRDALRNQIQGGEKPKTGGVNVKRRNPAS